MSAMLLFAQQEAQDIRDIRGAISVPSSLPWPLLLGVSLGLLILGVGVVWWMRRRNRRALSAYEVAKARLEHATSGAASGRADQLAEQVSTAVREYVEHRFEVRAAHRTTEEFLSDLLTRSDLRLSSHRDELTHFLTACDLAKFAGRGLASEQRLGLCGYAQRFVDAAESSLVKGAHP